MKLLIDTHALVWWGSADPRLSGPALAALSAPDNDLYFSAVAAWEFQWIQARGRIDLAAPLDELLELLPITSLDLAFDLHRYSASLPPHHGDPIDRIMIAQALRDDMILVTRDGNIRKYNVRTLW
ncbi:MAG: type II toxin-antitoxin system VapC family toxin [Sphingomonadaceae bacterium]|nr:type II toxin-antitoxin system VapC family toxin [Sphingomonadaceae bacterium]